MPAHAYAYSFAPNAEWSRFFAGAEEIRAYFERVARERGVMPLICFNREATDLSFRRVPGLRSGRGRADY